MRQLNLLSFAVVLLLSNYAQALTFKSDGSIVQSDGTVVQQTAQDRYLEALAQYRAGEPVTRFPTAKTNDGLLGFLGAEQATPSGYFGTDIVDEGAPLIPLPKQIDPADPIADIAENLGMSAKQFTAALVSTASNDWLAENGIDEEVVSNFDDTVDNFLAAEEQAIELTQNGQTAINATGLTAQDIRDGALDELLENPEAFLESAPILIGAPIDVQQSFATRAQSKIAEARGFEIGNFEAVTLDLDALDAQALAEATQQEIENLRAEGIFAVDGTNLTVDDVLAGNLDETIGVSSALVNASDEVFAAYEARLSEKLAEEAGISIEELNFVNQAVQAAGVTSAEEAGRVAAQAAARFNEENNLTELVAARQAANQAENLARVAEELQQVANEAGTQEALRAAEEAVQAAESAAEAARIAGEAAAIAGGAAARSAEEAAWEAASQQAYEQTISAARAAGRSAEEAAAEAAQAAAAAGEAAYIAAAEAAGRSVEEAAASAAAEAAEQAALRDLEAKLESGELTPEQFQEAIQNVPSGG